MVFKFTILINVLLASGIRAQPAASSSSAWAAPTGFLPLLSAPISYITTPQDTSDVLYSSNWAGAVRNESEGTFTNINITGTLTVPTLTQPSGSALAWVGIDGKSCPQDILQVGIYVSIDPDGKTYYDAWCEWFPDTAIFFVDFIINPGDEIRLNVAAHSKTSGRTVVENLTTGKTASQELTSSAPLCQQDAEWIVEDFKEEGSLVPFAAFGKIEFTNAVATGSSGKSYTPDNATLVDLKKNNTNIVLTSVAASGDTLTIVSYV